MPILLSNFESHIASDILRRGKSYWQDDAVGKLTVSQDNTIKAKVQGSQTYKVSVVVHSGEIIIGRPSA